MFHFDPLVGVARGELEKARTLRDLTPTRAPLFQGLALAIRQLFDESPALKRFELSTKMRAEAAHEGLDRVIRQRLEVAIDAPGCEQLASDEQKLKFIFEYVPHWLMGFGSLTVDETTPWFEPLGSPHQDVREVAVLSASLAIDRCFEPVQLSWDVELAKK